MIATGIDPMHIELAWPVLWPFLERAIQYSDERHQASDLLAMAKSRELQLWGVFDRNTACAGIATKLLREPTSGRSECLIWLVGGERLSSWCPDFLSKLIPWAKVERAQRLVAGGRKGWSRWAQRYGFSPIEPRNGMPYWGRPI